ncbi:hypothetical protein [Stenotrophomonas maltophilia]
MKRGRSTGKQTLAQQARLAAIKDIGCIVAYSLGIRFGEDPVPAKEHHFTFGGKHGQKR